MTPSDVLGQACDRCHRRKTRCDKARPRCSSCSKTDLRCVYTARIKEPMYRREFVEKLEKRVHQLQSSNRVLTQRLASVTGRSHASSKNATDEGSSTEAAGLLDTRQDDVTNEVSFLSTHAGGDRQFLGSASGLFLASLVGATVQVEPTGAGSADDGRSAKSDWSADDNTLPSRQLAGHLIDAYLAHDALCYPILHPQSVLGAMETIYADPTHCNKHAFGAFVFNMVLAIAMAQEYKFKWQILPDAETHHQRAMVHFNAVLSMGGIQALQAMLLLCQFRLGSFTKDASASGSLWHLLGIAARMCFELGLHRECSYQVEGHPHDQREPGAQMLSTFEAQEVRRRCFWCVFALDRVVSITLGRPLAINAEDVDVKLPLVDIGDDASPSEETFDVGSSGAIGLESPHITPKRRIAIFVHIVRYRTLCGKILTSLHRCSRSNALSDDEFHSIRGQSAAELEMWRAETASLNLLDMDLSAPLAEARSSFRSKAWYELLYHNGVLLLYRPSPTISIANMSEEGEVLNRIYTAAKQSITLYSYLFRSRKINFSWITLHALFLAGLSYIYAVSRHFRASRRQRLSKNTAAAPAAMLSQTPSIIEVVNDTRTCSNLLVAVSERCNAQKTKTCHEVFNRLSDAVLADAIELHTAAASRQAPTQTSISGGVEMEGIAAYTSASTDGSPLSSTISSDSACLHGKPFANQTPQLAVDTALRDSLPDLQHIYDAFWGDDAVLQLSMDWIEGLDNHDNFMIPQDMSRAFSN